MVRKHIAHTVNPCFISRKAAELLDTCFIRWLSLKAPHTRAAAVCRPLIRSDFWSPDRSIHYPAVNLGVHIARHLLECAALMCLSKLQYASVPNVSARQIACQRSLLLGTKLLRQMVWGRKRRRKKRRKRKDWCFCLGTRTLQGVKLSHMLPALATYQSVYARGQIQARADPVSIPDAGGRNLTATSWKRPSVMDTSGQWNGWMWSFVGFECNRCHCHFSSWPSWAI